MDRKNILIHIGCPKSGSSFLSAWFQHHPSFIFNEFHLTGFQNTEDICKFAISQNNFENKYFVVRDVKFSATREINNLSGINEYQEILFN